MKQQQIELILTVDTLSRLLRERALVVSEFTCHDLDAHEAVRLAVKSSVMAPGK